MVVKSIFSAKKYLQAIYFKLRADLFSKIPDLFYVNSTYKTYLKLK